MNDTNASPAAALHSAEQPDQGGQRPGRRPSRRPRRTGYSRGREDSGLLSVTGFPNGLEACRSGLWLLSGPAKGSGLHGPALADMDFRTRASS